MAIGKKIHELRLRKGMSINQLAKSIGVSPSTLRDWEQGREIKGEPYTKIATALDCSLSELLGLGTSKHIEQLNKLIAMTNELSLYVKNLRSHL